MQKEELFKDKYEDQELAELIDHADDKEYLDLNIDKLLGIVKIVDDKTSTSTDISDDDVSMEAKVNAYNAKIVDEAVKKAKEKGEVIEDTSTIAGQISYEDVLRQQNMSKDIFTNRDITRSAVRKFFDEDYYVRIFSQIFEHVRPSMPSFVRDVTRYTTSLKIEDPVERLKAYLKYAKAIKQRGKGDYTLAREIEKDLLKSIENEPKLYDLKTKDGLYNHILFTNKVFVFSEMLNDDLEFKKQFMESNPNEFYTFSVANVIIENELYYLSKDIGMVTGLHTPEKELQSKGLIETYLNQNAIEDIYDDNAQTNNSTLSFTRAYLASTYENTPNYKLNLNVGAYGLDYTKDDNEFEYFGDMDVDDIYENLLPITPPNSLEFNCANKTQQDVALVHGFKMLENYVVTLDGSDFIQTIGEKNKTKDFLLQSVYIGNKSVYDLAKEHLEASDDKNKDFKTLAASYFIKALNNPEQTISLVTYKMGDKGLTNSVVTLEKNYDKLINSCKKSHGLWDKIKHIFVKYPEEKMVEKYEKTKAKYEQSFARTEILNDFNEKHKDQISEFNKPFEALLQKNKEDKQVIKNIEINEGKDIKEVKEVAGDNIIKENGMSEKEL